MPSSNLQNRAAANAKWARVPTLERANATQAARDGFFKKFLHQCDGDVAQAENAYRAYFQQMADKRLKARQTRKDAGGDLNAT